MPSIEPAVAVPPSADTTAIASRSRATTPRKSPASHICSREIASVRCSKVPGHVECRSAAERDQRSAPGNCAGVDVGVGVVGVGAGDCVGRAAGLRTWEAGEEEAAAHERAVGDITHSFLCSFQPSFWQRLLQYLTILHCAHLWTCSCIVPHSAQRIAPAQMRSTGVGAFASRDVHSRI